MERARAVGIASCATVSGNLHAAVCMARGLRSGATVKVIPQGEEAAALAELPLTVLDLAPEQAETFAAWGVRTLGMMAALPENDLAARMGQEGRGSGNWRAASVRISFNLPSRRSSLRNGWNSILP